MTPRTLMLACAPALLIAQPAAAQDYYTGQVLVFAGGFCPSGTLEADGTVRPFTSYPILAQLLGDTFGGNRGLSFGVPDLRGRTAIGSGQGPGLAPYPAGQSGGAETATLPRVPHDHAVTLRAYGGSPNTDNPTGAAFADFPAGVAIYYNAAGPQSPDGALPTDVAMGTNSIATSTVGGGEPVPVPAPYLVLRYCIVTDGRYPSR